jgi:hypothetical protein
MTAWTRAGRTAASPSSTVPPRAALYLRVSTARQAEHDVLIPSGPMGVKNITAYLNQRRIFTRDGGRWGIGQVHRRASQRNPANSSVGRRGDWDPTVS